MSLKLVWWFDYADSRRTVDEEGFGMVTAPERPTECLVSSHAREWLSWSKAPFRR